MEKDPNRYYIYALLDTRKPGIYTYIDSDNNSYTFSEYEPFYIGFASGDYRPKAHFTKTSLERREGQFKNNVIKKIKDETGKNPLIFRVKEHLTEQQAIDLEIELIKTIGKRKEKKGPLSNVQDGGNPGPGYVKTTPDTYNRLRELHLGKPLTSETIEKMKQARPNNIYEVISPDSRVYVIENLSEFCKEHDLNDGCMRNTLSNVHGNTYKGWHIKYLEKNTGIIDRFNYHYKVISDIGEIYTTNDLNKLCKEFNIDSGHLVRVSQGKGFSHMGFTCERLDILPNSELTHFYEKYKYNYYIYLPSGKEIIDDNLKKISEENDLSIKDLNLYIRKEILSCNFIGFRLEKIKDTKQNREIQISKIKLRIEKSTKMYNYVFTNKDGNIFKIGSYNVIEFCKNNNLSYEKLHRDISKYPNGVILGNIVVTRELIYKDFLTNDSLFTNIEAT